MVGDNTVSNHDFKRECRETEKKANQILADRRSLASVLFVGRQATLTRELQREAARSGESSVEAKRLRERLTAHDALAHGLRIEEERALISVPKRKDGHFILYGRVVDTNGLGLPGLTVSATVDGKPVREHACSGTHGSYILEVQAEQKRDRTPILSLRVSSQAKAFVESRAGDHDVVPGGVVYEEIVVVGDTEAEPCAPPPES